MQIEWGSWRNSRYKIIMHHSALLKNIATNYKSLCFKFIAQTLNVAKIYKFPFSHLFLITRQYLSCHWGKCWWYYHSRVFWRLLELTTSELLKLWNAVIYTLTSTGLQSQTQCNYALKLNCLKFKLKKLQGKNFALHDKLLGNLK